jgi:hypothetical protein
MDIQISDLSMLCLRGIFLDGLLDRLLSFRAEISGSQSNDKHAAIAMSGFYRI